MRSFAAALVASVVLAGACSPGGSGGAPGPGGGGQSASPQTSAAVPEAIADLMARTSMSAEAQRMFLRAEPRIEGAAELRRNCQNTSGAHTLGCFLVTRECRAAGGGASGCTRRTRIHLLRIQRADIKDLIYVSAAHEMLHAVYEELPAPDRRRVDRDLEATLPRLDRCKLEANLEAYSAGGPEERLSELHSTLATEFPTLSPSLEAHYARFLLNRQLVVQAHERTLGGREREICSLRGSLDQLEARIGDQRAELQRLRAAGDVRAYNARVPSFNSLVRDHNRRADAHNRKVREYNQLLASLGGGPETLEQRNPAQAPPA